MLSETAKILKRIQVNGKVKHHVINLICFAKLAALHLGGTDSSAFNDKIPHCLHVDQEFTSDFLRLRDE